MSYAHLHSHRMFHVPAITNSLVSHLYVSAIPSAFMAYDSSATDYDSVLELAQSNSSYATIDSDALQYFAARKSLRARPSRKH